MIDKIDFAGLAPARRADALMSAAQSDLARSLWRAAMGEADGSMPAKSAAPKASRFDSLVALLLPEPQASSLAAARQVPAQSMAIDGVRHGELRLGVNGGHAPAIQSAAARTGVPASALAAIIDAEAAKSPDGSWRLMSRNPRSSAAGLGQFLSLSLIHI